MRYIPLIATVALIPMNVWFVVQDHSNWLNAAAAGFAAGVALGQVALLAMRRHA